MKRQTALEIICALLVLLFLYTSINKFLHFNLFRHDMHNQPFPRWFTGILVYSIPIIELVISVLLLLPKTRIIALWSSLVLMSLFTLYTALVLGHAFSRVPCGCGGVIRNLSWPQHLVLNIFYTVLCCCGLLLANKNLYDKKIFHGHETGAAENPESRHH